MQQALEVIQTVSNVLWVVLAVVAVRLALQSRDTAGAYVAATFVSAAMIVGSGVVFGDTLPVWGIKAVVLCLLAIPFLLHRFVVTMDGCGARMCRILNGVTAVIAVITLSWTSFPGPGGAMTPLYGLYTVAFLALWAALTGRTAWRLWRAAVGQPSIVRHRLRLLSAGSIGLGIAILAPSAGGGLSSAVAGAVAGIVSGILFLLGFAPPRPLRAWWREPEEAALLAATRELMLADGPEQIADILLPSMVNLIGATGSALVDDRGGVIGTHGRVGAEPRVALASGGMDLLKIEVAGRRTVLLWTSPYSPMFGQDERRLVAGLAVLSDLALDRVALLQAERAARRDAEAANRDVEAFVATITHDLRNPLTAIHGMAELLAGPLHEELSERALSLVGRISANSEYMASLVTDILSLAEVRGRAAIDEPVDLTGLLRELRNEIGLRAPQARIHLAALPVLHADPMRMRRLFENLLGNAIDHAGRRDVEITVEGIDDDDPAWFQIAVRDNGRGVRAEDAQQVFGMFERGPSDGGGTGLGLAICRKIVEVMGGSVWFAATDSGADLRIRLRRTLLVAEPSAAPPNPVRPPAAAPQPANLPDVRPSFQAPRRSPRGELADHPARLPRPAAHGTDDRLLGR